jgi:hypothetical protein
MAQYHNTTHLVQSQPAPLDAPVTTLAPDALANLANLFERRDGMDLLVMAADIVGGAMPEDAVAPLFAADGPFADLATGRQKRKGDKIRLALTVGPKRARLVAKAFDELTNTKIESNVRAKGPWDRLAAALAPRITQPDDVPAAKVAVAQAFPLLDDEAAAYNALIAARTTLEKLGGYARTAQDVNGWACDVVALIDIAEAMLAVLPSGDKVKATPAVE